MRIEIITLIWSFYIWLSTFTCTESDHRFIPTVLYINLFIHLFTFFIHLRMYIFFFPFPIAIFYICVSGLVKERGYQMSLCTKAVPPRCNIKSKGHGDTFDCICNGIGQEHALADSITITTLLLIIIIQLVIQPILQLLLLLLIMILRK